MCRRVGNKCNKNSGAFYLSEISRGPVGWGIPSKTKGTLLCLILPITKKKKKKRGTKSCGLLWIWEATCFWFGCVIWAHLGNDLKSYSFWVAPRTKLCNTSTLSRKLLSWVGHIWPSRSNGIDVAVTDRGAVWSLCQDNSSHALMPSFFALCMDIYH